MLAGIYGTPEDYRLSKPGRVGEIVMGCLTLLFSSWLIVRVGPEGGRFSRLRQASITIREATITMAAATVVYSLLMVGGGIVNATANRYLAAAMATCTAVTMGASGVLSWERYLVVHPDYKPRRITRVLVHGYIFLVFVLPFLMSWVYLLISKVQHSDQLTLGRLNDASSFLLLLATIFVFLGLPARMFFDIILGISIIARIAELRRIIAFDTAAASSSSSSSSSPSSVPTAAAGTTVAIPPTGTNEEQRRALLVLSIKIVVYLVMSILLNVVMHVQLGAGFHPLFTLELGIGIPFCFAYLTYFCFDPRASLDCCSWRAWRGNNDGERRRGRRGVKRRFPAFFHQALEEGKQHDNEQVIARLSPSTTKRHPMFYAEGSSSSPQLRGNGNLNSPSSPLSPGAPAWIEMGLHVPSFASPVTPLFRSSPLACVPEERSGVSSVSASSIHAGSDSNFSGGRGGIGTSPDSSLSSVICNGDAYRSGSAGDEESKSRVSSSSFYRMRDTILTSGDYIRPSLQSSSLVHEEGSSSGGAREEKEKEKRDEGE